MPFRLRITLLVVFSLSGHMSAQIKYPETRAVDQVDTYHGVTVADPYRWLEDDIRTSSDVAAWVKSQNDVTFSWLSSIKERDQIRQRLTALWNYERISAPVRVGNRWVYSRNNGLQNQNVIYITNDPNAEPKVLLDPNTWSADGTVALGNLSFSDDGNYAAFSVSEAGSDWTTWRVLDVATGRETGDEVRWSKYSGATWTKDSRGFFYGRYDEPKPGEAFQSLNLNQKVYYHRVGTPQSRDVLVYARPDFPEWNFSTTVSEDGRWLVINISKDTGRRDRVIVRDLQEPLSMPVEITTAFENDMVLVGSEGRTLWFRTDRDAPRGRVVAVSVDDPRPEAWTTLIPERDETLEDVRVIANLFVASWLKDASTRVNIFRLDGTFVRDVPLPGLGTAGGFAGKRSATTTYFTFSSFATPPSIYHYDFLTGAVTLWRTPRVDFNPDDFVVEQVFVTSKDGTRVPMFLTSKKGLKRDGTNPTLLYGYGGFNISLTPGFAASRIAWLELGGVFAVANLRGGGEYGEEWHRAGTKLRKQNVFDDFFAAAEWLISEKITQPSKLAIQGGSNGGLLVGACMTQRPELFGACLPAVGVMDMLRFQEFTAGRFWVDDYGSSADPEEFKVLRGYSPYHNLKAGTRYPSTMVTTADTDDRVVPGHSFKFAAALQKAHAGENPVLIRIEARAGHGAGKPTSKIIEQNTDEIGFLIRALDMQIPAH